MRQMDIHNNRTIRSLYLSKNKSIFEIRGPNPETTKMAIFVNNPYKPLVVTRLMLIHNFFSFHLAREPISLNAAYCRIMAVM